MNKYRLHSTVYERDIEEGTKEPKRVFFLSVEGNDTEREYFEGIENFKNELGIDVLIKIEVLSRYKSDTHSAPAHVIQLLEEFLELRKENPDNAVGFPGEVIEKYGAEILETYIESPNLVESLTKDNIDTDLREIGFDLNYRRYLSKYTNPDDKYAIIIDRDCGNHSVEEMTQCINHCLEHNYNCYISNPCFEFWLLLHFMDVEGKISDNEISIDDIKENKKVSNRHTFVSFELSKLAGHGKSHIKFDRNYKDKIDIAIQRAQSKAFASTNDELIYNVGTNIWQLIEEMKQINN